MTAATASAGLPGEIALPAASLTRRMACFVYEVMLLFGIGLIPGVVGTLLVAHFGSHLPTSAEMLLRLFALLLYGVYFVWLWSTRGQTLAMQTWQIRLVTASGARVTRSRAMTRYVLACFVWFVPATVLAAALHLAPWPSLGLVAAGIVLYAVLALGEPQRQFWHDRWCGTRLVDARPARNTDSLRSRRR